MGGISDLPQEILVDIFSRLPPKSVGRCRCLAKPWRTLLSTPDFLKSHFTQKPHKQNLILVTESGSIHSINNIFDGAAAVSSRNLDLPNNIFEVEGCCDGIVLLVDEEYNKFLVNPITLEQVKIPDSPLALTVRDGISLHGFGYDRLTSDYKVVALSYYETDDVDESEIIPDIFVDVYSVKRGVWKRVDCSTYNHSLPFSTPGAFANGAIHWKLCKHESGLPSMIAAFDLADEVFREIPPPSDLDNMNFVFGRLAVLGGCLCMIDNQSNIRSDIWIMKEYGVKDSWTKFIVDADYYIDHDDELYEVKIEAIKPLCFIGDEEIVLLTEDENLVVYNLKERTSRDMLVDGVPSKYMDGGAFVESLVSPAGGSMLQSV